MHVFYNKIITCKNITHLNSCQPKLHLYCISRKVFAVLDEVRSFNYFGGCCYLPSGPPWLRLTKSHLLCRGFRASWLQEPIQPSLEARQPGCSHHLRWEEIPWFCKPSWERRSFYISVEPFLFRQAYRKLSIKVYLKSSNIWSWIFIQNI